MKMKYADIVLKHQQLAEVSQLVFPRKIQVAIDHNLLMLGKELDFYNAQRKDIESRYVERDENGVFITSDNGYVFESDSDKEDYLSEIRELNNSLVDVDIMNVSTVDTIETYSSAKKYDILSEHQKSMLDWMFVDIDE